MVSSAVRLAVLLVLVCLSSSMLCEGTQYIVGDNGGWALDIDYQKWASGKQFFAGDSLVFNYGGDEETHNVIVVTGSAVDGCVKEPNLGVYESGNDELFLSGTGDLGFLCGMADHCTSGMKLKITVKAAPVSQGVSLSPAAAAPST
ncbi:hypothetical protein SUGI_1497070 [Cryptomeria japonica]|uniref:Phytocyanin domain-containing protein n=1 Tax=Cryptomeria japonica TaxID=3369 RepID=A0AAD3NT71_CRYJA|nr:basic blue protein-like [Cryptomeria japonica]XP_059072144.1 basic blue protein-like [Cryptomeria japonica]GLJ58728.1 hypothetical protein SUGI_1472400 [Cryptomeria japonica]GLJ59192.1 hypothetical protein SUGI_1497070 [Cryptomeria japonica]